MKVYELNCETNISTFYLFSNPLNSSTELSEQLFKF